MGTSNRNRFKETLQSVIDFEMIPAKITFFFTDGYFGSTVPFMNNFYVSLGLTATQAGLISGISLLVSSLFNPLWSTLADVTGYRKVIFTILCIGTGSTVFSMPFIEQAVAITNTTIACTNKTFNVTIQTCTEKTNVLNVPTLFKVMLILNIIAWIFYTSLRCYVDGTVTNVANTRATKKRYGPQRAISCAGYALFNILSGFFSQHYHPKDMSQYTAIFYVFLPCVICMMPIGCVLINQAKFGESEKRNETKRSEVLKNILSLFNKLEFVIFLLSVIVEGVVLNVFNCFFFLFMEKNLNSPKYLMSIALGIGVFFEILMFATAARFIKLFRGTITSLIIGILSFFPRFVIMSYIENPWFILATQPLHAFGMGLAWTSIVDHTYKIVPADVKVTAIALMSSIVFIGTSAISNMVGGVLFDLYGGRVLFRYTGMIAVVWSLFMILYYGGSNLLSRPKTEPVAVNSDEHPVPTYPQGISQEIDL